MWLPFIFGKTWLSTVLSDSAGEAAGLCCAARSNPAAANNATAIPIVQIFMMSSWSGNFLLDRLLLERVGRAVGGEKQHILTVLVRVTALAVGRFRRRTRLPWSRRQRPRTG